MTCADVYAVDHYQCSTNRTYDDPPRWNGEDCHVVWPYCLVTSECGDPDWWECSGGYCLYESNGEPGASCNEEQNRYCSIEWGMACVIENGQAFCTNTPIVLELDGQPIRMSSPSDGVIFDLAGNGHPTRYSWPLSGAFLVLDRNGNGIVDNGGELFGNATSQSASDDRNGFRALAEFDKPENGGNSDGKIDAIDAVFNRLRLWIDANRNGASEPEELFTLNAKAVVSIGLDYRLARRRDRYGNVFRYRAKVDFNMSIPVTPWAWDVMLVPDIQP